jgi:phosphatidylinositol transfer protein SFH5
LKQLYHQPTHLLVALIPYFERLENVCISVRMSVEPNTSSSGANALSSTEAEKPTEVVAPTSKPVTSEETKDELVKEEKDHHEPNTAQAEKEKEKEAPAPTNNEAVTEGATAPAPATENPDAKTSSGPIWPQTPSSHPLIQLFDSVPQLVREADHSEVWGINLSLDNPFYTKLILQKFLRANSNDLTKAKEQLLDTLKWRKEFDPVKAAEEAYEKDKFDGLGYVLELEGVPESTSVNGKDIVTFNVYGAVKDNKKTFGDLDR